MVAEGPDELPAGDVLQPADDETGPRPVGLVDVTDDRVPVGAGDARRARRRHRHPEAQRTR